MTCTCNVTPTVTHSQPTIVLGVDAHSFTWQCPRCAAQTSAVAFTVENLLAFTNTVATTKREKAEALRSKARQYRGENTMPRVPCPSCSEPRGSVWNERRESGRWRRHSCKCDRKYVSVIRPDGSIEVYDNVAPKDEWKPHTPLIAEYPA